jgi:hypothetical protein
MRFNDLRRSSWGNEERVKHTFPTEAMSEANRVLMHIYNDDMHALRQFHVTTASALHFYRRFPQFG